MADLPIPVAGNVAAPSATTAMNRERLKMSRLINQLRYFLVAIGGGNGKCGAAGKSLFLNGLPLPLPLRGEDPSEMGPSPNLKASAMRSDNDSSKRSGPRPPNWRLHGSPYAGRRTVGCTPEVADQHRPEGAHHHPIIERAHLRTGSARRHQGRAGTGPRPCRHATADRAIVAGGKLAA